MSNKLFADDAESRKIDGPVGGIMTNNYGTAPQVTVIDYRSVNGERLFFLLNKIIISLSSARKNIVVNIYTTESFCWRGRSNLNGCVV